MGTLREGSYNAYYVLRKQQKFGIGCGGSVSKMTGCTLDCQNSIAGIGTDGSLHCSLHVIDRVGSELSMLWKWYQGKGTVVHVHIEAYRGRRNIAPLILDFGARRGVVITPRALHPQERMPVPIECVLEGPKSGLDVLEKRKKINENSVLRTTFSRRVHTFSKNLVTTVQNLFATSARRPGFVHPWSEVRHMVSCIGCVKEQDCCHGISFYHMLLNVRESFVKCGIGWCAASRPLRFGCTRHVIRGTSQGQ